MLHCLSRRLSLLRISSLIFFYLFSSTQTASPISSVLTPYSEDDDPNMPGTPLTLEEVAFLKPYLHPQYLQSKTIRLLSQQFAENSVIMLEKFLNADLANDLESALASKDKSDGLAFESRQGLIPGMKVGHLKDGWEVIGPSTRQRYLSLEPSETNPASTSLPTSTIQKLLTEVLPSTAFRAWLTLITSFIPLAHKLEARRFRPGLDYTLARGEEEDPRLDLRIGLTPGQKWEDIEGGEALGGWEVRLVVSFSLPLFVPFSSRIELELTSSLSFPFARSLSSTGLPRSPR